MVGFKNNWKSWSKWLEGRGSNSEAPSLWDHGTPNTIDPRRNDSGQPRRPLVFGDVQLLHG